MSDYTAFLHKKCEDHEHSKPQYTCDPGDLKVDQQKLYCVIHHTGFHGDCHYCYLTEIRDLLASIRGALTRPAQPPQPTLVDVAALVAEPSL